MACRKIAAQSQTAMLQLMERRLAQVQEQMNENLHGSARRTAQSLGELQQRLQSIDKAQENITKLSGDVLSLQDILSNKQTRGAFGEIQLLDIVGKALPSDAYAWQATLSNGRRADCLIHLPNPPGPIAIDSKFPLEAYEALRAADTDWALKDAVAKMKADAVLLPKVNNALDVQALEVPSIKIDGNVGTLELGPDALGQVGEEIDR